jgi:hypothetical protein
MEHSLVTEKRKMIPLGLNNLRLWNAQNYFDAHRHFSWKENYTENMVLEEPIHYPQE